MTNRGVVAAPRASVGLHNRCWHVIGSSSTTANWNATGQLRASTRRPPKSPVAVKQSVHMPHRFQRKQLVTPRVLALVLVTSLFCIAIFAAIYQGAR
jgi:hypothetical protein